MNALTYAAYLKDLFLYTEEPRKQNEIKNENRKKIHIN